MRPEFGYRVELGEGSDQQWLYSDNGYAVLASQPYGTMYLITERDQVNRLLGISH